MRVKQIVMVAALCALLPATARADGFVAPFVGFNFGGDAANINDAANDGNEASRRLNFGVAAGWMGGGVFGFEVDLAHSPNFFETTDSALPADVKGNITTLMANVIVGAPIGGMGRGVRPYASGGIGVIRSKVNDVDDFFNINNNDFGVNLGAGVMGFFTDNVGIRGDVRYFRALVDPEPDDAFDLDFGKFDFWRGSVGLAFRF